MTEQEIKEAALFLQRNTLILQAVLGLVTATIGIAGVILGQWAIRKAQETKDLYEWWFQYSVKEGVEPVIRYVHNLEERIAFLLGGPPKDASLAQSVTVTPIPQHAIYRVLNLTGCPEILTLIYTGEGELNEGNDSFEELNTLHRKVLALRGFLDTVHTMFIIVTVEHRSDIVVIHKRKPIIIAVHSLRTFLKTGNLSTDFDATLKQELDWIERSRKVK